MDASPTPSLRPVDVLSRLIAQGRFDYAVESVCQGQVQAYLEQIGAEFIREYPIGRGFVDFYFPNSGLVLEIKAHKKWSAREVYRQCERYCDDDRVSGLVLLTGKAQGMPGEIAGKPVRVIQLGAAFL